MAHQTAHSSRQLANVEVCVYPRPSCSMHCKKPLGTNSHGTICSHLINSFRVLFTYLSSMPEMCRSKNKMNINRVSQHFFAVALFFVCRFRFRQRCVNLVLICLVRGIYPFSIQSESLFFTSILLTSHYFSQTKIETKCPFDSHASTVHRCLKAASHVFMTPGRLCTCCTVARTKRWDMSSLTFIYL